MSLLYVATNFGELDNSVLVEALPGPYIKNALSSANPDVINIEIIRNTLYTSYLEDFHNFCLTTHGLAGIPTD